jgi:hypothetical protein
MMRDDDLGVLPPEKFETSTYATDAIAAQEAEVKRLLSLDHDGCVTEVEQELKGRAATRQENQRTESICIQTMFAMLKKVQAWSPPTPDHAGLKTFMVEQLTNSIDHEDMSDYRKQQEKIDAETRAAAPESVVARKIVAAQEKTAYHTQEHQEEIARTDGRNKWLADLRASLVAGLLHS